MHSALETKVIASSFHAAVVLSSSMPGLVCNGNGDADMPWPQTMLIIGGHRDVRQSMSIRVENVLEDCVHMRYGMMRFLFDFIFVHYIQRVCLHIVNLFVQKCIVY